MDCFPWVTTSSISFTRAWHPGDVSPALRHNGATAGMPKVNIDRGTVSSRVNTTREYEEPNKLLFAQNDNLPFSRQIFQIEDHLVSRRESLRTVPLNVSHRKRKNCARTKITILKDAKMRDAPSSSLESVTAGVFFRIGNQFAMQSLVFPAIILLTVA